MLKLFKDNPWFFMVFALFLLGGIPFLAADQGALLIQLNDHRSPGGDLFFRWFTKVGEGYGYLAVFLLLLVYKRRAAWGVPLLGVAVSLVAWIGKTLFQHPRPYLYFEQQGLLAQLELIPGVKMHKGLTSFPSGHTMAAFALFTFLALCFPRKPWLSLTCFCIALLVGVSRMYLVQHFFEDVYSGALLGLGLGILAYYFLNQIEQKLLQKA
ncbi:phosphatase PAP2 family protein [Haliscomenobacter sp.]|uniref:phosphatase PAP2 family protein n=1 Tax=Haliscomenobacter sp. TaxID=2717303 RepID=UPI003BACC54D